MKYFKSRKPDPQADLIQGSEYTWQITRPASINATDITRYTFGIIKHPTLDEYAVGVDGNMNVNTMTQTEAQGSGNALYEDFTGSRSDFVRIRNLLRNNTSVLISELIPRRWDELTELEMTNAGWFV